MSYSTPAFLSLLVSASLAGCTSSEEGILRVQVTDLPGDIADFRFLNVTVTQIELTMKDGSTQDQVPTDGTFDLRQLVLGNLATLFRDEVPAGNYTRLALRIQDATGVLVSGGMVAVKAPGGSLFLNQAFTVAAGEETTFVFDVVVHKQGNGQYLFQPNATGSRVK